MLVVADSLTKRYRQVTALEDCSLAVQAGEVFGLLGPNGAGKTTLIRILMGFLRPTSGIATIGGLDCYHDSLRVRQLASYLPGEAKLFRSMRGSTVLEFFAGTRPGSDLQHYRGVARRLDFDLSRRVASMSTGMRQKLALAVTLAARTPLMILDEPTANLDPSVRSEVVAMVLEAKKAGHTVLFSSHVLGEVEEACDRVVILRAGRAVHSQAIAELRRKYRIHVTLRHAVSGPLEGYHGQCSLVQSSDQALTVETDGELAPLLAWLASLPIEDIRVEQVGLRSVYEQFHRHGLGASQSS